MYNECDTQIYTTGNFLCPLIYAEFYKQFETEGAQSIFGKNRVSDDATIITIAELFVRIAEESDAKIPETVHHLAP